MKISNKPTQEQKNRWSAIASIGCIICHKPATIHHCKTSMGCRKNHEKVIPLCPEHHLIGGYGVAIHAGKTEWESIHGTEEALMRKVEEMLNEIDLCLLC